MFKFKTKYIMFRINQIKKDCIKNLFLLKNVINNVIITRYIFTNLNDFMHKLNKTNGIL